jgi:hypothetical protein
MYAPARNVSLDAAPRARHAFLPRLALRRRSADHPMVMFALITGTSLGVMAFASAPPPVLETPRGGVEQTGASPKQDRLRMRPAEIACDGQAWGAESDDCLVMIAREAGRDDVKVRRLASAAPLETTPNIF